MRVDDVLEDLGGVVEREAEVFDLPLGLVLLQQVVEFEVLEGAERRGVQRVDEVEIEVFGLAGGQLAFEDVFRVGHAPDGPHGELGGEHVGIARILLEGFAGELLALAVVIRFGRVEIVDPGGHGRVDEFLSFLPVDLAVLRREPHHAVPEEREREVGVAEFAACDLLPVSFRFGGFGGFRGDPGLGGDAGQRAERGNGRGALQKFSSIHVDLLNVEEF